MDAPWPHSQHRWKEEPAFISTPATTVLTRLLPDATRLLLEACDVDDTTAQITLRVRSTQTSAPCPLCATPARRIHSDYGRTLAKLPAPSFPTPRVLGVDDFALRKRQRYGTVLIDLERRSPVALLPDRTAESLAQWLRAHPGVQVIARDRSTAYADGARQGAPAATQVADRLHLLQNLREALDQVFSTHSQALDAVNVLVHQQPVPLPDGAIAVPVPPQDLPLPAQQRAGQRQARRQALQTQVWALHRQGWTAPAIAQHVGMSLRTVQRDLQSATFVGRKRRRDHGESGLTPYTPYLLERGNAGCYNAMRLFRALRQRGYAGGYGVVVAYARRVWQAQGLPP